MGRDSRLGRGGTNALGLGAYIKKYKVEHGADP